jgi:hypothetical protein
MMIPLTDTDFQPLEQFALKWRWIDSRWKQLPEAALSQIFPLITAKARELSQRTDGYADKYRLSEKIFEEVLRINAKGEVQGVRDWLLRQVPDQGLLVIVSWEPGVAVLVRWSIFCDYWNTFCYPASDDVFVYSLSEEWVVFWAHEEFFSFGRRRASSGA